MRIFWQFLSAILLYFYIKGNGIVLNSNVDTTNKPKQSVFSGLGASVGASAVITGGFGALSSVKRNGGIFKGGIPNAFRSTHELNNITRAFQKNCVLEGDTFVKRVKNSFNVNYAAAKNYGILSNADKALKDAEKQLAKYEKTNKLSLWQKIRKIDGDKLLANRNEAQSKLAGIKKNLEKGVDLSGVAKESLKDNFKATFKEELINPLNIAVVAISCVNRVRNEAIPVFKNESKIAGIKKAGEIVFKTAADTVSNAGFSTVFRWIGMRVGAIGGPVGIAVGGTIGDIVGSFFSNKFITKVFGEDKEKNAEQPKNEQVQPAQTNRNIYTAQRDNINFARRNIYA